MAAGVRLLSWALLAVVGLLWIRRWLSPGRWRRATVQQEQTMRAVWDRYLAAVAIKDGVGAAACVTAATFADYDRMRQLALRATREQLRAETVLTRSRVLLLRAVYRAGHLAAMDGARLFAMCIEAGWTDIAAVAGSSLRGFEVDAGYGRARYVSARFGAGPWLGFTGVDGDCRVDMADLLAAAAVTYQRLCDKSKQDEDAFVLQLVADETGREAGESLWLPLV
jgi:hypothetical protein